MKAKNKKTPKFLKLGRRLQEPCYKFADLLLVGAHNIASRFHFLFAAVGAVAVDRIPRNERVLTSALRAFEKWEVLVQVFHWHLHHVLAFLTTKLHNHAAKKRKVTSGVCPHFMSA